MTADIRCGIQWCDAFRVSPKVRKINIITDAGSTLAVSDPEIGFLTMDSTRNVVLVHGNDPQVEKRPIIGAYAAAVDGISGEKTCAAS